MLKEYDLILTTYDTLKIEWIPGTEEGLFQPELWARVVLDEGKQTCLALYYSSVELIRQS